MFKDLHKYYYHSISRQLFYFASRTVAELLRERKRSPISFLFSYCLKLVKTRVPHH